MEQSDESQRQRRVRGRKILTKDFTYGLGWSGNRVKGGNGEKKRYISITPNNKDFFKKGFSLRASIKKLNSADTLILAQYDPC